MIADSAGGAWSFGSSILTFAFPMILFIAVAAWLYVTYTKPELVPGHRRRHRPSMTRKPTRTAPTRTAPTRTRPGPRMASDLYHGCLRG